MTQGVTPPFSAVKVLTIAVAFGAFLATGVSIRTGGSHDASTSLEIIASWMLFSESPFAVTRTPFWKCFYPSSRDQAVCQVSKPALIDCNKSTEDYHTSNNDQLYGRYAEIRTRLDYDYHVYYTEQRQFFQDSIIDAMLESTWIEDALGRNCSEPTMPWIVFTAGSMGAGKSHVIKELHRDGVFPLHAYVSVDPDHIRHAYLTEFASYVEQCPELAGEQTRKEAGMISEVLTQAALRKGQNVLVDGTLRDAEWYRLYFQELRAEYPSIRIAILHVVAPREAVLKRAEVSAALFVLYVGVAMNPVRDQRSHARLFFFIEPRKNHWSRRT